MVDSTPGEVILTISESPPEKDQENDSTIEETIYKPEKRKWRMKPEPAIDTDFQPSTFIYSDYTSILH